MSRDSSLNHKVEKNGLNNNLCRSFSESSLDATKKEVDFGNVIDYLPQGIRIINTDYKVKYINPSFATLSGVKAKYAIGKKCYEVFPSPFCHTPDCRLVRILKGEKSVQAEIERTRQNGSVIPCIVSAFPLYDENQNLIGIMESFRDITDKKLLENRALEAEERYKAMIELSGEVGEGIMMLEDIEDKEGVIVFASAHCSRIMGYSRDELLNKSLFDLISRQERDKALERHRCKMKGESLPGLYEVTLVNKKGKHIPVELTSAVSMFRGKPANVVYLRNITERKKKEKKLAASELRFKALSNQMIAHQESERVMLSRELHDQFGQELASLRLEVLNLQRRYKELSNNCSVNNILHNVDSLINMTRDLAAYLRPGMLDKLGLISTLQWYAEDFEQKSGITCKVVVNTQSLHDLEISPDIAIVAYRIVQEALTNVAKHSQASKALITLKIKHDMLVISVLDNGVGPSGKQPENKLQLGIMGMQERASIVGGVVKINKQHYKQGFKVTANLPLYPSLSN